jgi:hypothetical protein
MSNPNRPDGRPVVTLEIPLTDAPLRTPAARTDTTPVRKPDNPEPRLVPVCPVVPDAAQSAPVTVRPDTSAPRFAEPSVQWTVVAAPDPDPVRRAPRAPQQTPRWPHIAFVVAVPVFGAAGVLAAALSSTVPLQIIAYAVVGGVVIIKAAGPVRAAVAAIGAALAKVGQQ